MNKGYKRVVLWSIVMAAWVIGYGYIAGLQGPNLSMYVQYILIGLFTYSQWGFLADVQPRWLTPVMLFYNFTVSYIAQYPMGYVDDAGIFFMALASTACGYSFYAAKRAAMASEPLFIDAEPAKRINNYILWITKSMIVAFIFGVAYWVYAEAIGFVISSLWTVVFATLISWKFIKVYRNQDENLKTTVGGFSLFVARGITGAITGIFLLGLVVVISQFAHTENVFEAFGALITMIFLLLTGALAFIASDIE